MTRPPRSERVSPDIHKTAGVQTGSVSLALAEVIRVLRMRAGLTAQQDLADECRRYLPGWMTMNRRLIQQIEKGEIPPEEVNDVWLLAIAAACRVDPVETFGINPATSGDLAPLINLIVRHRRIREYVCAADPNLDPSDLGLRRSGWNAEKPGQGAFLWPVPDDISDIADKWGWEVVGPTFGFDAEEHERVLVS